MDVEDWRPITDFPDYDVSDLGRVRSRRRPRHAHILRPFPDRDGQLELTLINAQGRHVRKLHHLVLNAFGPPRPFRAEAHHHNGDKTDNRPQNLSWCPPGSGAHRGHHNGRALFTEVEVLQIRADLAAGRTHAAIARRLSVSVGAIEDIGQGRTWSHLGGPVEGRHRVGREQRITQAQVDAIRTGLARGDTKRVIMRATNVSYSTVFRVRNNTFPARRGTP